MFTVHVYLFHSNFVNLLAKIGYQEPWSPSFPIQQLDLEMILKISTDAETKNRAHSAVNVDMVELLSETGNDMSCAARQQEETRLQVCSSKIALTRSKDLDLI